MSKTNETSAFTLYHYPACPFCAFTRRAIKQTELNIEQRDISKHPKYRSELIKGGGKPQVPCLRIEKENGGIQWLYESRDIIQFIQKLADKINRTA